MTPELKVKVSRYMSYLLRHNSENLEIDEEGFVDLDKLLGKLRETHDIDRRFIEQIVNRTDRTRFEIVGNKIRALYGHTVNVKIGIEEDKTVKVLCHGTTPDAVPKILQSGLKPMKRGWVHLSPTREIAVEVARRRASKPVVLEVNAEEARKNGVRFFRATDHVFLCREVPPEYLEIIP